MCLLVITNFNEGKRQICDIKSVLTERVGTWLISNLVPRVDFVSSLSYLSHLISYL